MGSSVATQAAGNPIYQELLEDTTVVGNGDALLGVKSTLTGAVGTTQHEVNERTRSIFDWLSAAQKADVIAGTALVDCSAAFTSAITWMTSVSAFMYGGARVLLPRGSYLIASTVSFGTNIQNSGFEGEGMSATVLVNGITHATAAEPCIKMVSEGNRNFLKGFSIKGNSVVGAGGNGHAISILDIRGGAGSTVWGNQQCLIEDVGVNEHYGFGKDAAGAAMPACGLFVHATLDMTTRRVSAYTCKIGLRMELTEKSNFYDYVSDACTNNSIYIKNCSNGITFYGAALNGAGAGGATDGLVYCTTSKLVDFKGGSMKNANPLVVNLVGNTNESISFNGVSLAQLDDTLGHTIARFGTGAFAVKFRDCAFNFVGTITDAVGVDIIQDVAGLACVAPEVTGCRFNIGDGGTYTACIWAHATSNRVRSPNFTGNSFGKNGNAGSATTYTDAILLASFCTSALVGANTFTANTNVTFTRCINLSGANVLNTVVQANVYDGFGTFTNKLVNTSANAVISDPSLNDGNLTIGMGTGLGNAKVIGTATINTTAVGNVGVGEDNLMTYSLPLASLNAAGKGVRIKAWGTTANNANAKTVILYFGTTAIETYALTINIAGFWEITASVFSTGTDTQDYVAQLTSVGAAGVALVDQEAGTSAQDDGAAITIKCTGTATADNDVVQQGFHIEIIN